MLNAGPVLSAGDAKGQSCCTQQHSDIKIVQLLAEGIEGASVSSQTLFSTLIFALPLVKLQRNFKSWFKAPPPVAALVSLGPPPGPGGTEVRTGCWKMPLLLFVFPMDRPEQGR